MSKCLWCGKESQSVKETMVLSTTPIAANRHEASFFVCPEHEQELHRFYGRVRRYALLFIILTVVIPLGMIISAIFIDKYWAGYLFSSMIVALGLMLIIFPFSSQSTFNFMSIATSIKLARLMGGLFIALGIILTLYSFHG